MQPRARSGSTKASLHRDTAAYLVPVAKKDARNEREGGGKGDWGGRVEEYAKRTASRTW